MIFIAAGLTFSKIGNGLTSHFLDHRVNEPGATVMEILPFSV